MATKDVEAAHSSGTGLLPAGRPSFVEAPTMPAALDAVLERLGPDAQILRTERITRRAIGTRRTEELVRLTAVRPADTERAESVYDRAPESSPVGPIHPPSSRFGVVFQRELEDFSFTTQPVWLDLTDDPIALEPTGPMPSSVSAEALTAVGLDAGLVSLVARLGVSDHETLQWALAHVCSAYWAGITGLELPLVGFGAPGLADALGVEVASGTTSEQLHLVVSSAAPAVPTQIVRAAVVSAADVAALPEALGLCFQRHLRLGYVIVDGEARVARPDLVARLLTDLVTVAS